MSSSFEFFGIVGLMLAYFLIRAGEYRVHRFNSKFLIFAGAEEKIPHLMFLYYFTGLFIVLFAFFEYWYLGRTVNLLLAYAGLITLTSATLLRIWSISSLGRVWSMRCLYIPGVDNPKLGPYRFFKHPEYTSRFLDGLGICLFFQAFVSMIIFVFVSVILLLLIIKVENRQIRVLSRITTNDIFLK